MVKLNNEEVKKVLYLQQIMGVAARDFVENEEQMIIVVHQGDVGKAIGRDGRNINSLERMVKKSILFVEYSDDVKRFIENIFFPTKLEANREGDEAIINVDGKNKKFIIGKGGNKIKLARQLLDRHFGIKNIRINENPRTLV